MVCTFGCAVSQRFILLCYSIVLRWFAFGGGRSRGHRVPLAGTGSLLALARVCFTGFTLWSGSLRDFALPLTPPSRGWGGSVLARADSWLREAIEVYKD